MPENYSRLGDQAFASPLPAALPITFQSQKFALNYISAAIQSKDGLALIEGPRYSGESALIRKFADSVDESIALARVDAAGLGVDEFLRSVLTQYGYQLHNMTVGELLRMMDVFSMQQSRVYRAPVIVVENAQAILASTLIALNQLATFKSQGRVAMRFVLIGTLQFHLHLKLDGKTALTERINTVHELKPLTCKESLLYLHARLQARGIQRPDRILPVDVCDRLHDISGGLPGLLDAHAMAAMKRARGFAVGIDDVIAEHLDDEPRSANVPVPENLAGDGGPLLKVTPMNRRLREYRVSEGKMLIGRSGAADIVVKDQFCSKYHALLFWNGKSLMLADLNSTNGTLVNSVTAKSRALRENDIVSIGDCRIKVTNLPKTNDEKPAAPEDPDTAKYKSLAESRQRRMARFLRIGGKNPGAKGF